MNAFGANMRRINHSMRIYILAMLLSLGLCAGASYANAKVVALKSIALTVSNLDRSVAFYEQALDFKKVSEQTIVNRDFDYVTNVFGARVRSAELQLGDEKIQLNQFLSASGQGVPIDSRSNDLWFQHFAVVVSDMDKAFAQLQRAAVTGISSAPQTIPASNQAAAGIKAYKFKDPDGHPLEVLYFPPDKGRAKWQGHGDHVFLGIDHSAITVADTARSLAFYRDTLGLAVAGQGLNSGTTQEQLDNAFGAVVRITGLRPQSTQSLGLEFLQYLTPSGGRPARIDARVNDLTHVHIILQVDDVARLADELSKKNVAFISPQTIAVKELQCNQCLMVKDPDGHAMLLVDK
jgi:catechol 2,3-dioxygenase-like lactoylglutathione lyase family enzyme